MKTFVVLLLFTACLSTLAQERYFTKAGQISFYSHAPMEDITAANNQTAAFFDSESGELTFAVLIKSFTFEKALMQEHFNENYMESDKFPKASFKGVVVDYSKETLLSGETYKPKVKGTLTIRGIDKELIVNASFLKDGESIKASSEFIAMPADFEIKIPALVKDNIAKEIEVTVITNLQPYKR